MTKATTGTTRSSQPSARNKTGSPRADVAVRPVAEGHQPSAQEIHGDDPTTLDQVELHRAAGRIEAAIVESAESPYERERVIGQVRVHMATSVAAMLEVARCLQQIKDNEPHGEFTRIVETRLEIPIRTATKLMWVRRRLTSPALSSNRSALADLGKTKLFELLAEDDESLVELLEGGTLAGATLDEIHAMSSRELRAALQKSWQSEAAKDRVIADKNRRVTELIFQEEVRRSGTPNEKEQQQLAELRDAGIKAEAGINDLVKLVNLVTDEPATEAAELLARQTLEYIVQRLADACGAAGLAVDVLGERVEPGWKREINGWVDAAHAQRRAAKGAGNE